jgi:hypothetical protein
VDGGAYWPGGEAAPHPDANEEQAAYAKWLATEARLRATDAYAAQLVVNVTSLVSYRIGDAIFGRNGYAPAVARSARVEGFGEPGLDVRLDFARQGAGKVCPLVSDDGK